MFAKVGNIYLKDVRNLNYARAVSLVLCKDKINCYFFAKKGIIQDLEDSRNNIELGDIQYRHGQDHKERRFKTETRGQTSLYRTGMLT
jgi:hypothetical protein